jgi:gas vesicle protein
MIGSFVKGAAIGLIAGATVGLMMSPKTKKRMMKSKPVRAIRSIGEAVEDMMP